MGASAGCRRKGGLPIFVTVGLVAVLMALTLSGAASAGDVSAAPWASTSNDSTLAIYVTSPGQMLYWQGTGGPSENLWDITPTVGSASIEADLEDSVVKAGIASGEFPNPWTLVSTIVVSTAGSYIAYRVGNWFDHWVMSQWGAAPSTGYICGSGGSACHGVFVRAGTPICVGTQSYNYSPVYWTPAVAGWYARSAVLGGAACGSSLAILSLQANSPSVAETDSIFGSPVDTGVKANGSDIYVWQVPADATTHQPAGARADEVAPYTNQSTPNGDLTSHMGSPSTSARANALRAQITGPDDTCSGSPCPWGTGAYDEPTATTIQQIITDLVTGSGATPLSVIPWPPPNGSETYDQYVARLESLGYMGKITTVQLEENNGDSEFVGSGVPCTSVASGTSIGALDPVTIYENPATLGTGNPDMSAAACTGRLATSKTSNRCTFHTVRWEDQIVGNEDFYNTACADTWSYFWANQQVFNDDGTITQWALDNGLVMQIVKGVALQKDADLWKILSAQDPDPSHWAKGTTTGTVFNNAPHPFQIHFYWHLPDNTIRFDVDFKVRFNTVFTP